ncbi:unnamed protein product, partial [Cyprideis torosa]
ICGKALSNKSALGRHKLIHCGEKPFGCEICGKAFADRSALVISGFQEFKFLEERTRRRGKTFEFRFGVSITTHEFIHDNHHWIRAGDKAFSCSICVKEFRSKSLIHYHEKKHSEGIESGCAHCDQPSRLVEGLQLVVLPVYVPSSTCVVKLRNKNFFNNIHFHNKILAPTIEHDVTVFVINFLKMNSEIEKEPSGIEIPRADDGYALPKFEANEMLTDQHEFRESEETPLLTDFVPGSTDNNNQTSGARAPDQIEVSEDEGPVRKGKNSRIHCQQKKRFICGVCGKSVSTKQNLQSHEFIHTGEKPFACRICGKSFADRSALGRHELIHSGEKPFACKAQVDPQWRETFACRICGKAVADRSALVTSGFEKFKSPEQRTRRKVKRSNFELRFQLALHTSSFTIERNSAWKICEKYFAHNHHLSTHKFCGKAFAQRSTLGRHKLIHSGQKRFACRMCGKGFRSKEAYQGHSKKHCEEEMSVCALCGDPFRLLEDLEKHLKWHIQ